MQKPTILVTSAAGHTGMAVTFQLINQGYKVKALVRGRDKRSETLRRAGAEVVVGDLFDLRDVRSALIGVQRAYFCPPFANNLLHCATVFAIAAEEAKLETVTLLSGWNPHAVHPSIVTREHWLANHIYRWMPSVDVVHVNPGMFAFTHMLGFPFIKHFGMFVAPFGNGKNAPPSNEDIAGVVTETLINPSRHIGKNYRPTGPEMLSPTDMAQIYSKVLDRKVTYTDAPFSMFVKAAQAQGFPLMDISQVKYFAEEVKANAFEIGGVTQHFEEVTGRSPENFESITRRYFANPSLIHHSMTIGTKFQAMGLMAKMMFKSVPDLQNWELSHGHPLIKKAQLAHESDDWVSTASEQELNFSKLALKNTRSAFSRSQELKTTNHNSDTGKQNSAKRIPAKSKTARLKVH